MLTDPQPPQLTAPPAPDPPYWKGGVQDDDRLPARSRRYWQGRLQPSPPRFDFAGKALAPATLRASRRPDWQRGAGWLAALSRARVAIKRTSLAGLLLPAGEASSSDAAASLPRRTSRSPLDSCFQGDHGMARGRSAILSVGRDEPNCPIGHIHYLLE